MKNMVETMINLFTVQDDKVSILLTHKKDDPYKGYWILPTSLVKESESLDDNIQHLLANYFNHSMILLKQNAVFGEVDRHPKKRVIGISYVGFIDPKTIELNHCYNEEEVKWFDVTTLPKLGYDHSEVIKQTMDYLRNRFRKVSTLKELYPSDFTLPEIQHIYEIIFQKKIDRRNFRKKFFHMDLIEETGDLVKGITGRPAKLYRFKENIDEQDLF